MFNVKFAVIDFIGFALFSCNLFACFCAVDAVQHLCVFVSNINECAICMYILKAVYSFCGHN